MNSTLGPHRMETTFVHLGPDGSSVPLQVTQSFWEELSSGKFAYLGPGRLVSQFHCAENWTSWEMHPNGEEFVCLLAGAVDLVLSHDGTESRVALKSQGSFAIVPRGTWHTANVHEPSSMLFITSGEGTEHRPR